MYDYASIYDLLYGDRPYEEELSRVLTRTGLDGWSGKRVLEIGCGTGGHTRVLLRAGARVWAADVDGEMLAKARTKCKPWLQAKELILASSVAALPRAKWDVAIALFYVLTYITKRDDLESMVNIVASGLRKGGVWVFDVWNGGAAGWVAVDEKQGRRVTGGAEVSWAVRTTIHGRRATMTCRYEVNRPNGGTPCKLEKMVALRLWTPAELEEVMESKGFVLVGRWSAERGWESALGNEKKLLYAWRKI